MSTPVRRLVIRATAHDWPLFWDLQLGWRWWAECFDHLVVVHPQDSVPDLGGTTPGPRWGSVSFVPCGLLGSGTPMTGLQTLEAVRQAARPGADVSMISEPDVLLMDLILLTRVLVRPDTLTTAWVGENEHPAQFADPRFYFLPMSGPRYLWERALSAWTRVFGTHDWCCSDRLVTRLCVSGWVPVKRWGDVKPIGRMDSAERAGRAVRAARMGVPYFHAVKNSDQAQKLIWA